MLLLLLIFFYFYSITAHRDQGSRHLSISKSQGCMLKAYAASLREHIIYYYYPYLFYFYSIAEHHDDGSRYVSI